MNRERTAILLVSYGCASAEMKKKTLDKIEEDIRMAYQTYPVFHAWSSQALRQKFSEQEGNPVSGVQESVEELLEKGIQKLVVQPTYVLAGLENKKMAAAVQEFSADFSQIIIGSPLLDSHEDRQKAARVIVEELRPKKEEALVLVGHGTSSRWDAAYRELDEIFARMGFGNVFLGAMEGRPDLETVLRRVKKRKLRRICLAPFMITAGKHAVGNIAGEQKTSWKSRFEEAGLPAACIQKGLGEYGGIRRLFVEHLKISMKLMDD